MLLHVPTWWCGDQHWLSKCFEEWLQRLQVLLSERIVDEDVMLVWSAHLVVRALAQHRGGWRGGGGGGEGVVGVGIGGAECCGPIGQREGAGGGGGLLIHMSVGICKW